MALIDTILLPIAAFSTGIALVIIITILSMFIRGERI